MITSIIQGFFLKIKIQPNMSEQEKKQKHWNQAKVSLSTIHKAKKNYFTERVLRKRGKGGLNKKQKEGFLTSLTMGIKKDPTMSIRKHANELKIYKKTEDKQLNNI